MSPRVSISLRFGSDSQYACDVDSSRVLGFCAAPRPNPALAYDLARQLEMPVDFPPFRRLFVSGDRVALALDRHTPQAPQLIAEICRVLVECGVQPDDIVIVQPAALDARAASDPRFLLPTELRDRIRWCIHDPVAEDSRAYLAASAQGERVYLARHLIDADVTISVGWMGYDSVIGYRGTNSVFFPGMSTVEAIARAHAVGHSELGPDDERPLRQSMDEVGWLLGNQFTVQVIPSAGDGACEVLAGANESVLQRGRQLLAEHWRLDLDERAEVVVAAVDVDAAGHGWHHLGAALATARNLVTRGGKIVLLTELADDELGPGLEFVRNSMSPVQAIQPLRRMAPPDLLPATELASAAEWARVYLMSDLDPGLVDDLFMAHLATLREVDKLLTGDQSCVFVESAQHLYGQVRAVRE